MNFVREGTKMKKVRHKIEIVAIVIILFVALIFVNVFSTHQFNSHEVRVKNFFYEPKDTIEVVNVGASEIYAGFSPEYIWHNYGITTYNLATAAAPMSLAKSEIEAAIEYQNPKLIVVSLNGIMYNDDRSTDEGYTRMWVDNMPDGILRNETIDDLVTEDVLSYKIKALKYHDNIWNLKESLGMTIKNLKSQTTKEYLTIRGVQGNAKRLSSLNTNNLINMVGNDKTLTPYTLAKSQLEDLLEYLKENNIENVIFVNMPRFYSSDLVTSKYRVNYGIQMVESYGYDVYDFDDYIDEIGLDVTQDYYNLGHLNIDGQAKMSAYMAEYIYPKYGVTATDLDTENTELWNQNYDVYVQLKDWVNDMIENYNSLNLEYNYKVVDHIIDGTIDTYQKTLIKDAQEKIEKAKNRNSASTSQSSGG